MFVFPDKFVKGGSIAEDFTSHGGAPVSKVPTIKWVGQPGAEYTNKEGEKCPTCSSYAVNIPGDFTELNDQNAFGKDGIVVGTNPMGVQGLEVPCPKKGIHRYKTTLWSLTGYLGNSLDPFSPDTPHGAVKAALEAQELARATFFANLKSP